MDSPSSSSLRPRNRRLISIDDDYQVADPPPSSAPPFNSSSASAFTSSASRPSPIPSPHPSRASSANRSQTTLRINSKSWGLPLPSGPSTSSLFSPEYFQSSWTSIQGIASTLLGSDVGDTARSARSAMLPRTRRREGPRSSKYMTSGPDHWGPAGDMSSLARGSQEDRLVQLQAKKREALLESSRFASKDASGKHKRRVSTDQTIHDPQIDEPPDARVYLHHVQPGDTLAGVTIKYNCSQTVFCKVNRFWPNDSIQTRKVVYLPVDSCSVRGLKVSPESITLIDDMSEDTLSTPTLSNPQSSYHIQSSTFSSTAPSPSLAATSSLDTDPPWTHESWVRIDGFASPVEIARLPRKCLGFFPPARRKSMTYSDSTPLRSPVISPALSPSHSVRSSSATRQRTGSSATNFISALRGPGGVGTLGIEARGPGPAPDKLNQMFPNAAAGANFESVPGGASMEHLGGKVEGWVRKMASKAAKEISGEGDLIELMESWDPMDSRSTGEGDSQTSASNGHMEREGGQGSGRADDHTLRERFPARRKEL